jgi:hypothetical protein
MEAYGSGRHYSHRWGVDCTAMLGCRVVAGARFKEGGRFPLQQDVLFFSLSPFGNIYLPIGSFVLDLNHLAH